ncbi:MAG: hypothetical protein ACKOAH_12755, partial [Pirellula sp.]
MLSRGKQEPCKCKKRRKQKACGVPGGVESHSGGQTLADDFLNLLQEVISAVFAEFFGVLF